GRSLELRAWVSPRLLELLQYVAHRRQPELLADVPARIDSPQRARITGHFLQRPAQIGEYPLHHRIGFPMHRRGIERVVTAHDPQEPCRLLEGLGAQTRDFLQGLSVGERAVLVAIAYQRLGKRRRES